LYRLVKVIGWNFPEPGAVTHCLGIISMDFDPHIGQRSFFIKDSIKITNKIVIGIESNKVQKSASSENPDKDHISFAFVLNFLGILSFFDSHHAEKF
jgi:hypothetical protein